MKRLLSLAALSALASVMAVGAIAIAQPGPPPDAGPLTPAEQARRAQVIARVGDARITVGDVEDQINAQSPFLRLRYADASKRQEFVENLIRFELLAREAEKRGYGHHEEVERTVKQNAVQQLIRRQFDERLTVDSVPMADVQTYYDAHPEEFNRPEMVRASHIQVATEAEARALVTQARAADAAAFRNLARERSTDTETKLRGGDLRYFTREPQRNDPNPPVAPELVHAAFALHELGDVSPPVHVGAAWSVVKLTGRRPAEVRTVEEAAPTIRMRLWRDRRQQAIETFVADLHTRLHPEIHAERMDAIHLDPVGEPTPLHGAKVPTAPMRPGMPRLPGAPGALRPNAPGAPLLPPVTRPAVQSGGPSGPPPGGAARSGVGTPPPPVISGGSGGGE